MLNYEGFVISLLESLASWEYLIFIITTSSWKGSVNSSLVCCLSHSERQCGAMKGRTPVAQFLGGGLHGLHWHGMELSPTVQLRASWEGLSKVSFGLEGSGC